MWYFAVNRLLWKQKGKRTQMWEEGLEVPGMVSVSQQSPEHAPFHPFSFSSSVEACVKSAAAKQSHSKAGSVCPCGGLLSTRKQHWLANASFLSRFAVADYVLNT